MLPPTMITCTLCGFKAALLPDGTIEKNAAEQSAKCKVADELPGFDCPRLQEAIDRATRH